MIKRLPPLPSSGSGGNYYVKNMNQPSKTLSVEYDSTSKLLHGSVDNTNVMFESPAQVPDYSRGILIAFEWTFSSEETGYVYHGNKKGNYCSQYNHNWFYRNTSNYSTTFEVNDSLSFECPENGFIYIYCNNYYPSGFPDGYQSFTVFVKTKDNSFHVVYDNEDVIANHFKMMRKDSALIPVQKGNIIYYGKHNMAHILIGEYYLYFYPYDTNV